MGAGTVTVNAVADQVLSRTANAKLWDRFMSEYVPQTPEFAFVREMNPTLRRELFESAFMRWGIRLYWSQFAGKIKGVTITGGELDRFVLDQAWIDANCQLPDMQEWAQQLVTV